MVGSGETCSEICTSPPACCGWGRWGSAPGSPGAAADAGQTGYFWPENLRASAGLQRGLPNTPSAQTHLSKDRCEKTSLFTVYSYSLLWKSLFLAGRGKPWFCNSPCFSFLFCLFLKCIFSFNYYLKNADIQYVSPSNVKYYDFLKAN